MQNKKPAFQFGKAGYYIALVLCACAIGICGYLYYRSQNNIQDPSVMDPTGGQQVISPTDDNFPGGDSLQNPTQGQPDNTPVPLKTGTPLSGQTVAAYAMNCLSYNPTTRDWRVHDGLDIAAQAGSPVVAAADGTVVAVENSDTMGKIVVIAHVQGYETTYASLATDVPVAPGDHVTMGQTIGYVGNTALLETALGDHLHFAVTQNGKSVDPTSFLPQ